MCIERTAKNYPIKKRKCFRKFRLVCQKVGQVILTLQSKHNSGKLPKYTSLLIRILSGCMEWLYLT